MPSRPAPKTSTKTTPVAASPPVVAAKNATPTTKPETGAQSPDSKIRPTKKQHELLKYIEQFIGEHGYSPSYREIMNGCDYTSVATVALHVNSLINRGHLRKRDHSARSLEVVNVTEPAKLTSNEIKPDQEKWLVEKVEYYFHQLEQMSSVEQVKLDELYVLIGALKVLGLPGAAQSFIPRLSALKQKVQG